MNDQLQQALTDILTKTTGAVEVGTTFLQEQLPEVIRQLLIWKAVVSALHLAAGIVLALTTLRFVRWAFKRPVRNDGSYKYTPTVVYDSYGDIHPGIVLVITGGFIMSLFSIRFIVNGFDWLQIWLAPKIYLIEYAASLTK